MPIDYSRYPPNWKKEIRPAVLQRANHCCEFCGVQNGSTVWSYKDKKRTYWVRSIQELKEVGLPEPLFDFYSERPIKVVLTIAHLDHDEQNWEVELSRLAALCQLCHLRYDAKEKYRRVMSKLNWGSK